MLWFYGLAPTGGASLPYDLHCPLAWSKAVLIFEAVSFECLNHVPIYKIFYCKSGWSEGGLGREPVDVGWVLGAPAMASTTKLWAES